jgi:hypothetical protein
MSKSIPGSSALKKSGTSKFFERDGYRFFFYKQRATTARSPLHSNVDFIRSVLRVAI